MHDSCNSEADAAELFEIMYLLDVCRTSHDKPYNNNVDILYRIIS